MTTATKGGVRRRERDIALGVGGVDATANGSDLPTPPPSRREENRVYIHCAMLSQAHAPLAELNLTELL